MMKSGTVLAIIGGFITFIANFTLGPIAFPDMHNECADWFVKEADNAALSEYCNGLQGNATLAGL